MTRYQYVIDVVTPDYSYVNPIPETLADTKEESLGKLIEHCNSWVAKGRPNVGRRIYMHARVQEVPDESEK